MLLTLSSLYVKTINYLSLLFEFLCKTLLFFSSSMDSLLFSNDYDDLLPASPALLPDFSPDLFPDPLYLVPFSWWSGAREEFCRDDESEIGIMYNAKAFLRRADYFARGESYIFLDLKREGEEEIEQQGDTGKELALVSEWMFLKALKWYCEMKNAGDFVGPEANANDLFSLEIRLSYVMHANSLTIKIVLKDNEVEAFEKACSVFYSKSGLLRILDFSGQTGQYIQNNRVNDSRFLGEETFMELNIYGPSCCSLARGRLTDEIIEHYMTEGPQTGSSSKVNGCIDLDLYRAKHDSSSSVTCVLGLTGLCNLGNTCFLNSAIQCLVHTPKLVDYFLGNFKKDLNFENPLGMNGKLALAFGDLLRKLWVPGSTPVNPRLFKSTIAMFAPQFSGYNQHDSQEFLAFLLDGLHEDLNRVRHKPYIEVKEEDSRPDDEVADEHWQIHLRRNDSIIVDLCQGQYRSKLVCPVCKKLSITFDPFMYLSLPLPSTKTLKMTLTVLSGEGRALPVSVTVTVPKDGTLKDLVDALSAACSLEVDETFLVAEVFANSVLRFLDNLTDSVELVRDWDRLVAFRLRKASEESRIVVFKHRHEDTFKRAPSMRSFGIPLFTRVSDFSKGSVIREQFLKLLNPFSMKVEDAENIADEDSLVEKEMKIDEDTNLSHESEYESSDFQFFLDAKCVLSNPVDILMDEPVPISDCDRVNVIVSWPEKMIDDYDTALLSNFPEVFDSALLVRNPPESVSMYKCLDAFLKEEPLGPDDKWYCPSCKEHRQASKKLDLWRLPEVLVIHLKRFSFNRSFKSKLDTYVDFPVDDFDVSSYMVHMGSSVSHRYRLYAISNHFGGMGGGHYTAFVQHGLDKWYEFDDGGVFPITKEQIKTPAAYVLFYHRISDMEVEGSDKV